MKTILVAVLVVVSSIKAADSFLGIVPPYWIADIRGELPGGNSVPVSVTEAPIAPWVGSPDNAVKAFEHKMEVKFPSGVFVHGFIELTEAQSKDKPEVKFDCIKEENYTLTLVTADVDQPTLEYRSWLVTNIHPKSGTCSGRFCTCLAGDGTQTTPYEPLKAHGERRIYAFLVYQQKRKYVGMETEPAKIRTGWNATKWASRKENMAYDYSSIGVKPN